MFNISFNKLSITLALAIFVLWGSSVYAAPPAKVGFVDVQKCIRTIPAGKAAKKKLERQAKSKQRALDKKQNDLKKMKESLEKQASMLNENVKRQKVREYQQRLMELQEAFVKHQTELKKREAKLLRPILEKLEKVIRAVAKEQKFTMILELNESRVIYALPNLEITDTVIKRYGK